MALQVLTPEAGATVCWPGSTTITWNPVVPGSTYTIEVYHNGALIGTPTTNATDGSFDWQLLAPANPALDGTGWVVRVFETAAPGNRGDSGIFSVDSAPPAVNIDSPLGGTVSGTVVIEATASDTVSGVDRVEFYYSYGTTGDWKLIGYDVGPEPGPYTVNWDTTCVTPDGDYQIRALAFDNCGHSAESIRNLTVENLPDHYVQVLIDDPLCIPPYKPEAEQIVDFKVCVDITDLQVFPAYKATKILILGNVAIEVLYVANVPEQTVHTAHFTVPLKTFLKWEEDAQGGLDPCAILEPVIVCEHVEYKLVNPRTIVKAIVLFIGIKAISTDL